jgi:hypothetical protein
VRSIRSLHPIRTKETDMATTNKTIPSKGFSADEKAAMRERAKELKAESRSKADRADGERDLLA